MKQKMKMPKSGSFFNYLMSNNSSVPVAGQWATIMHYTDRSVVLVRDVSKDGKHVTLECVDTTGEGTMGHQNWTHTPNGQTYKICWYRGFWRRVVEQVCFTDKYLKSLNGKWPSEVLSDDERKQVWDDDMNLRLVDGMTAVRKTYVPIRILFGACNYYHDWEF